VISESAYCKWQVMEDDELCLKSRAKGGGGGRGVGGTSRTSALPHMLETDRFPCLATFAPAAAAKTHAPGSTTTLCKRLISQHNPTGLQCRLRNIHLSTMHFICRAHHNAVPSSGL
jgi:hypothetical protein